MKTSSFIHACQRVLAVARKELLTLFETPVAYIVTVLFLGISEFLFFKNVFLVGEASLSLYFNFLPWILLFVVPALTMGVFAQERESGTYETLATQPVTEFELLVGKLFALKMYLAGALALAVLPMSVSFAFFAHVDWGTVVGGYLASVSIAVLFVSIGLAVSALFSKQVSALLVTIAVLFFLVIAGTDLVAGAVPVLLTLFFERVSVLTHFQSMIRGVLDVRDVWYFASVIGAFLALTHYRLLTLRFGRKHPTRTAWRVAVILVVVTVLVSNVLGSAIPGRIDLTEDGIYTLSDATKRVTSSLPDVVTITLYASEALPAQLQPVLRTTRDTLKDYERYGAGNISVAIKDPSVSEEAQREAQQNGVQAVQFNVMGQSELSVKQGFLGVTVSYAGEQRSIPFVQDTGDLEYQLTSMLTELTVTNKKKVMFLTGHGEKSRTQELRSFSFELEKLYDVTDLTLDEKTAFTATATDTDLIIVADPMMPMGTATRKYLDRYLAQGGALFVLVQGVVTDPSSLSAYASQSDLVEFLGTYGVKVSDGIVFDLGSHETVRMGGGGMMYMIPYPFWARVGAVPGSPITNKIESVMMPWASALTLDEVTLSSKGSTATPLVITSKYTGLMGEPYDIEPNKSLPETDLAERTLAVALAGTQATGSRMVIIGNSKFLTDDIIQQDLGNLALGLGAVSWLAQDESLASIKVKSGQRRAFTFSNPLQQAFVAYGNMLLVILVPILIGLILFLRRRAKSKYTYTDRPVRG